MKIKNKIKVTVSVLILGIFIAISLTGVMGTHGGSHCGNGAIEAGSSDPADSDIGETCDFDSAGEPIYPNGISNCASLFDNGVKWDGDLGCFVDETPDSPEECQIDATGCTILNSLCLGPTQSCDFPTDDHTNCPSECPTWCGDGNINNPNSEGVREQCDEGAGGNVDGDGGCSSNCQNEEYINCYTYEDLNENTLPVDSCSDYAKLEQENREFCCVQNFVGLNPVDPEEPQATYCDWVDNNCKSAWNGEGGVQCTLAYTYDPECTPDQTFRTITVEAGPLGSNCQASGCSAGSSCDIQTRCPRVVQLPFFGSHAILMSIVAILIIYAIMFVKNRKN
jgi:hypothetical protein